MPDYNAIADVGETLKERLQSGLDEVFGAGDVTVTLDSPRKIEDDAQTETKRLSVYLYSIIENADLKNQPPYAINSSQLKPTPLTFDLFYMITAYGIDEYNKLRIFGRATQIMYENAILQGITLQKQLAGSAEQLRVSMTPLTHDVTSQIWQGLAASMRVAAFYLVTPVTIEPAAIRSAGRVKERELGES